jgi:hypothetical protein
MTIYPLFKRTFLVALANFTARSIADYSVFDGLVGQKKL